MHLSTSNSDRAAGLDAVPALTRRYRRWILISALGLLVFCLALEAVTRLAFSRISRIESRVTVTHRAALAVRPQPPLPAVLLLGNSLPLEGIDVPKLRDSLSGSARITSFFVEGTAYLDWYFGLRRLFQEGSHPNVVVLCINTLQLLDPAIRGDYSSYYLFNVRDLPEIRRRTDSSLTALSGLFLARYSLFYAGRASLRNFLLGKIDYSYAGLLHRFALGPPPSPSVSGIRTISVDRLREIDALCQSHGVRFVLLLPPGARYHQRELLAAGKRAKVRILIPIDEGVFGPDMFRDGFHLNDAGRSIFTTRLAEALPAELGSPGNPL